MADKLPSDLPAASSINAASDVLIVEQSGTVRKTTPAAAADAAIPIASQAEAQAGSDNAKRMTPLRVKQSIAAEAGTSIATYAQGQLADSAVQPSDLGGLATKSTINNGDWSGEDLAIANGGTGASTASAARSNLGLGALSVKDGIEIADIDAAGDADDSTFLRGDGTWAVVDQIGVESVSAGTGVFVDVDDPTAPVVSLDAGTQASLALADSAVQPSDLGDLAAKDTINNADWSGTSLSIANGGTGATSASAARANLGLGTLAVKNDVAVADIDATGDPDEETFLRGDGAWSPIAVVGISSIGEGDGISIDDTDPEAPIVALDTATKNSLALADSAIQADDLGDLATKDTVTVSDITATGTASDTTFLRGDGQWAVPTGGGGGGGDGTVTSVAVAAPTGFSVSGSPITTNGTITIGYSSGYQGYTSAEASKLAGIATGATANTGTVTSVGLSMPTGFSASSAITTSGTITVSYASGYQGYTTAEASKLAGIATGATANTGTVTSVAVSVPTGFSVSGSPITTSGTVAITYASGYEGFTTALKSKLDDAVTSDDVTTIVVLTQAEYDLITSPDADTLYIIKE